MLRIDIGIPVGVPADASLVLSRGFRRHIRFDADDRFGEVEAQPESVWRVGVRQLVGNVGDRLFAKIELDTVTTPKRFRIAPELSVGV